MPFDHIEGTFNVFGGQLWATGGITGTWYGGTHEMHYLDKNTNSWMTYTLDALTRMLKFHAWVTISNGETQYADGNALEIKWHRANGQADLDNLGWLSKGETKTWREDLDASTLTEIELLGRLIGL